VNGTSYLWIKALHVIAVIAWYAGLFYIFRLYVYHVQKRSEPTVTATLEVMERRLLRAIMTPAMVVALGAGTAMLVMNPSLLKMPWMHAKLGVRHPQGLYGGQALTPRALRELPEIREKPDVQRGVARKIGEALFGELT